MTIVKWVLTIKQWLKLAQRCYLPCNRRDQEIDLLNHFLTVTKPKLKPV